MLPACIVIAAVLMPPLFLIGFPLMGVPRLSTVAAIGSALFLTIGVALFLTFTLFAGPFA